jgi:hypothetical protein
MDCHLLGYNVVIQETTAHIITAIKPQNLIPMVVTQPSVLEALYSKRLYALVSYCKFLFTKAGNL